MPGIKIVAFLVRCTQSLLVCDDLDTDHLRFTDIEDCTSRLPALIAEAQRAAGPGKVVMGRCRFLLDKGLRPPPGGAAVPSG